MKAYDIVKLSLFCLLLSSILTGCGNSINTFEKNNREPQIFPDYSGVVIPPNIAPLNFYIKEPGSRYHIEISSAKGEKIVIQQASPKIEIPLRKWHQLLDNNKGANLNIEIYVFKDKWFKYNTIKDSIVTEKIESHLAYRLINTAYILWRKMGIYQRDVENFDEAPIYRNVSEGHNCVNCHSFCQNNSKKMSLHIRKDFPGTVILNEGKLEKLNVKTEYMLATAAYPAWHPNGEIIAYSVNKINQNFSTSPLLTNNVSDKVSDIILYNIKTHTITTSPKVSTHSRENLPTWSPDGKWLYFISAPATGQTFESRIKVKYDLLRIAYDAKSNSWGNVDTVLTSRETGLSITFPSISPDGRYLMFCMIDYGYFSIFHTNSDLYLLDLQTHKYRKLEINSPSNESYHGWSQSGRWFVFSSKRLDDVYSRPFYSYFDTNGKAHKAFVLPQKDPLFYDSFLTNYNRPELIDGKVDVTDLEMRDIVYTDPVKVTFDPSVHKDSLSYQPEK
jgi:hypothetical protein